LGNSLVDNDHSHLRLIIILAVELVNGFLELRDFVLEHLVSHGITNTVSEDDEVGWKFLLMVASKHLDGPLYGVLHLLLNDFLALALDQEVRVVLTQFFVGGGRETYDGVVTSVADINTDQHGSLGIEGLGELEVEEISSDLGVDLSQDIGGLGGVEGESVSHGDDLGRHSVVSEDFLVHLVVRLVAEDGDDHDWVSEDSILVAHHELAEVVFEVLTVVFVTHLDPVGLFDSDLKLFAGVNECVIDLVGSSEVGSSLLGVLVDQDPVALSEVDSLLDGELS